MHVGRHLCAEEAPVPSVQEQALLDSGSFCVKRDRGFFVGNTSPAWVSITYTPSYQLIPHWCSRGYLLVLRIIGRIHRKEHQAVSLVQGGGSVGDVKGWVRRGNLLLIPMA